MRKTLGVLSAAVVALGLSAGAANAQECAVWAPYDSAENIRISPNGRIVNRLRNGRIVYIDHMSQDRRGRPWAYVEGEYQGQWRRWGYIFTESLRCY